MQYTSLIERLRAARWFMRITALSQIFCFIFVFYSPSAQAAVEGIAEITEVPEVQGRTNEEKLSNALQTIKENVAETKATVDARLLEEGGIFETVLSFFGLSELQNESLITLLGLNEQVLALNDKALANFAEIEAMLKAKNLPDEILQRHYAAVNKYQADYAKLQMYIQNCATAESLQDQQGAIGELDGFLNGMQQKRKQQPFNPDSLPFGESSIKSKTREPVLNKEQFSSLISTGRTNKVLANIVDNLISKAYAQSNQPVAADSNENIDVVISDEIRAKAAELNNDPIEIYNWIYNNINYIPSFGSIQGSVMTLQNRQGNSFDISSLLIAMLRAANTPARYAYGAIEIPVEQVMNWVGGAATPEMASQTLGQAGIPNVAIIRGGKITHITLEHIWVEAWVDFEPSRGILNSSGDSWVPMDASFQQYEFSKGADLLANVPFDYNSLEQNVLNTSETDEALGKISNVPPAVILDFLDDYTEAVENFAASQGVDTSFESLLGEQKIINRVRRPLSAGLPYTLVNQLDTFSEIPAQLRQKLKIEIENDLLGGLFGGLFGGGSFGSGSTVLSHEINMPEINSKRLSITYKGATASDQQTLNNFQSNSSGSISLYLLNVVPVITLDGEEIIVGASGQMGGNQTLKATVKLGNVVTLSEDFEVLAGDEMVLSVIGNSISDSLVAARRAQVEPNTAAEQLQQVALNYWMESDYFNQTTAKGVNGIIHRQLSIGVFASPLSVSYLFGMPRSGQYQFRTMDVARSFSTVVAPDPEKRKNLIEQSGISESFLEGAVFDQLFGRPGGGGISAAQLIADANVAGIPIYSIDSTNVTNVLPLLQISSDIRSEILAATNAGKYVIIPERSQQSVNWNGTGYIIRDSQTGSGGYLISGGLAGGTGGPCDDDGSSLPLIAAIVLVIVVIIIIASVGPALVGGAAAAGAATGLTIRALVGSMLSAAAAAPVYAALEEACNCREAYAQCIDAGWTAGFDVSYGTLCNACFLLCDDSGGTVNWPDAIPQLIPIGGGSFVDVSCKYPGSP